MVVSCVAFSFFFSFFPSFFARDVLFPNKFVNNKETKKRRERE